MRHSRYMPIAVLAIMIAASTADYLFGPQALAAPLLQANSQQDSQIQADIRASLGSNHFKDVQITTKNGVVTLSGTVELYAYKEEAEKRTTRNKYAKAFRNNIQAGGAPVSGSELQAKLIKKVEYDRVGYGTTAFNAISVTVHDGVVTLGGHAYGPTDKDSAVSLVSYTPGARDVIDEVEVDPVSPMDDRIRIQVARSIYGHPSLNKYALDPGKPIRISVQNGNVTLYGVVDSQMDKDVAYLRANGVPGTFNVSNQLQVEGESSQRE
jgi:hyperosmotically inducible periplasmic protein